MDVTDFSNKLCHLDTAIIKYLNIKKAKECCSGGQLPLPNVVINTIDDVLDEKINQYEKQIIELATQLTQEKSE